MSTLIKMNKAVIDELFDKVISSTAETEGLLAGKGINMPELSDQNEIRITDNGDYLLYMNGEPLSKGMEAHIIALITGGLS